MSSRPLSDSRHPPLWSQHLPSKLSVSDRGNASFREHSSTLPCNSWSDLGDPNIPFQVEILWLSTTVILNLGAIFSLQLPRKHCLRAFSCHKLGEILHEECPRYLVELGSFYSW